jgi:hypothetical protein
MHPLRIEARKLRDEYLANLPSDADRTVAIKLNLAIAEALRAVSQVFIGDPRFNNVRPFNAIRGALCHCIEQLDLTERYERGDLREEAQESVDHEVAAKTANATPTGVTVEFHTIVADCPEAAAEMLGKIAADAMRRTK